MEITELGKYVTRSGLVVNVIEILEPKQIVGMAERYPNINGEFITGARAGRRDKWYPDGSFYSQGQVPDDLVSPYVEDEAPPIVDPAYKVIIDPDNSACKECGSGKVFAIQDPEGMLIGTFYTIEADADDVCDMLNTAYEMKQKRMQANGS